MLWTIFVILLVLWLLGVVSSYTLGGFIHILLVLALVVLVIQLITDAGPFKREPPQAHNWLCAFSAQSFRASEGGPLNKPKFVNEVINRRKNHGGGIMDKDRVKGAVNDAAGRAKRQVGEWTDNTDAQVEGAAQQIKGKAQKVVGNVKDAAREHAANVDRETHEKGRSRSVSASKNASTHTTADSQPDRRVGDESASRRPGAIINLNSPRGH